MKQNFPPTISSPGFYSLENLDVRNLTFKPAILREEARVEGQRVGGGVGWDGEQSSRCNRDQDSCGGEEQRLGGSGLEDR